MQYGPILYYEGIVPASMGYSRLAVAGDKEKPYGGTFGARSSDNPDGAIALMGIGIHDSPNQIPDVWPLYIEGWALKGSHPDGVVAPEIAVINQRGTCADIDPYNMSPQGQINALRLGVGKPGANSGEVSALIAALHVEETGKSIARLGIVIGSACLKMFNGVGRALNLARNHAIQWWSVLGPTSMIVCDTGAPYKAVTIRLGNGAIHFADAAGSNQFSFNLETGALYLGTGAIGPNGTIAFYVAGRKYLVKATPA